MPDAALIEKQAIREYGKVLLDLHELEQEVKRREGKRANAEQGVTGAFFNDPKRVGWRRQAIAAIRGHGGR